MGYNPKRTRKASRYEPIQTESHMEEKINLLSHKQKADGHDQGIRQKMWQKCGILCTKRHIGNDWGRMVKKIRDLAFTLRTPEFWQKNGGA